MWCCFTCQRRCAEEMETKNVKINCKRFQLGEVRLSPSPVGVGPQGGRQDEDARKKSSNGKKKEVICTFFFKSINLNKCFKIQ